MREIVDPLLFWYDEHKRPLPWRKDKNPYYIWVSEIMLQQTRVEAVKPYFERFTKTLPDVKALASCDDDTLMKLWEGLGYYSRVRNMQIAAREVMDSYGGELPHTKEQLLTLKGIGSYTAGAIASIAFQEKVPAVDGNVLRILARLSEDDEDILKASAKKKAEKILLNIMPDRSGDFNQALMDLGAGICLPGGIPKCELCPVKMSCSAFLHNTQMEFPVRKKGKERRIEERTILVIQDGEKLVLVKRPPKGLLAGMYEFPNIAGRLSDDEAVQLVKEMSLEPLHIERLGDAKHIFSHVEWHMTGYLIKVSSIEAAEHCLMVDVKTCEKQYPLPAAFRAYASKLQLHIGQHHTSKHNEKE